MDRLRFRLPVYRPSNFLRGVSQHHRVCDENKNTTLGIRLQKYNFWKHRTIIWSICHAHINCQRQTGEIQNKNTGCPKSSFLYFISLYFSTIELTKQIIETEVVSFNLIYYFHTFCAIFWLEYSICVLSRQRCPCASIFSSQTFFVFYSPNCSNYFLVFCEYHDK